MESRAYTGFSRDSWRHMNRRKSGICKSLALGGTLTPHAMMTEGRRVNAKGLPTGLDCC